MRYIIGDMLPTQSVEAQTDYFEAYAHHRPSVQGAHPGRTARPTNTVSGNGCELWGRQCLDITNNRDSKGYLNIKVRLLSDSF